MRLGSGSGDGGPALPAAAGPSKRARWSRSHSSNASSPGMSRPSRNWTGERTEPPRSPFSHSRTSIENLVRSSAIRSRSAAMARRFPSAAPPADWRVPDGDCPSPVAPRAIPTVGAQPAARSFAAWRSGEQCKQCRTLPTVYVDPCPIRPEQSQRPMSSSRKHLSETPCRHPSATTEV